MTIDLEDLRKKAEKDVQYAEKRLYSALDDIIPNSGAVVDAIEAFIRAIIAQEKSK